MIEEQKNICISTFRTAFDLYKTIHQKKINPLQDFIVKDYELYSSLIDHLKILSDLIKFCVLLHTEYYKSLKDVDLNRYIKLPKSIEELYTFFTIYPNCIDILRDDMFEFVSIEELDILFKISDINKLMYYSTIDVKLATSIRKMENEIKEVNNLVTRLLKKILPIYLDLIDPNNSDKKICP